MRTEIFSKMISKTTVTMMAAVFTLALAACEPPPPQPLVRADGGYAVSHAIEQRNASELDAAPQGYRPEEKPGQPVGSTPAPK